MMLRRRYPLVPADYTPGDAVERLEALHATPVGHEPKPGATERVRVGKDSPRIARLVAEIDEAAAFRRTYIRPMPKTKGDDA
jgi:hypothetical protein